MWSGVRMTAACPVLRPSRRSLLLSGALLGTLGLAGCDPEGAAGEDEETEPPRAPVTVEKLTTSTDLYPPFPTRAGTWSVSPVGEHPMAMLVCLVRGVETELYAQTLESVAGIRIPIDTATSGLTVDSHGGAVRVLAEKAVDGDLHHVLWRSEDLVEWSETDLGNVFGVDLSAFGDGIVVASSRDRRLSLWDIQEDGAVDVLTPIPIPDDREITVDDLARAGKAIAVLLSVLGDSGAWVPHLVHSENGGATWGEPMPLPEVGENSYAHSVRAVEQAFVVVGGHDVAVGWDEEWKQTRPVAWSLVPGEEMVQEEIPLPLFGVDGWNVDGRGNVNRDSPVDYEDISSSSPIIDAAAGGIHCAIYFGDDCRRATRGADGRWSVSELDDYAPFEVIAAVTSPAGQILLSPSRAAFREAGSEGYASGLSYSRGRSFERGGSEVHGRLDAVLQDSWPERTRDESKYRSSRKHENLGVSIVDNRLEPADGFPEEARSWPSTRVHHLPGGAELLTAIVDDEDGNQHIEARLRTEGDWAETTLLEVDGVHGLGDVAEVDGTAYLPVYGGVDEKESLGGISVLTSADGTRWETLGVVDPAAAKKEGFAGGARINDITAMGDAVIAIGTAYDTDDVPRAAIFRLEDGVWAPELIPDFPPHSWLKTARVEGGAVLVDAVRENQVFTGVLAEDGTVAEAGVVSDHERRGMQLELGDGALLAPGWIDRSPKEVEGTEQSGHGACIWASPDGGSNWTATVLPSLEGRYPAIDLARDGDDVVAFAALADVPVVYRISDAKSQVLAALE